MREKLSKAIIIKCTATVFLLFMSNYVFSQVQYAKKAQTPEDKRYFGDREILTDSVRKANPSEKKSLYLIKDSLYRYTLGEGRSTKAGLVLVTSEGIIITDPLRYSGAIWLKDELKKRFNLPVKYVIYSHAHYDHIGGAEIFQADGAKIIAQQNALEVVLGEKLPTAVPDITFIGHEYKLQLGGQTVKLNWIAPCHSNSMINIYYPRQKVMHATDYCPVNALPWNDFTDFYYDGWIENLEWLSKQDFEILEAGHYEIGKKVNVALDMEYLKNLHDQVLDLIRRGCSWDQLYRLVKMDEKFKTWIGAQDMFLRNISGMYRWVSNHRRGVW